MPLQSRRSGFWATIFRFMSIWAVLIALVVLHGFHPEPVYQVLLRRCPGFSSSCSKPLEFMEYVE